MTAPVGDCVIDRNKEFLWQVFLGLVGLVLGHMVCAYVSSPSAPDMAEEVTVPGEAGAWLRCRLDGSVYYRQAKPGEWKQWRTEEGDFIPYYRTIFFDFRECGSGLDKKYEDFLQSQENARIKKKLISEFNKG